MQVSVSALDRCRNIVGDKLGHRFKRSALVPTLHMEKSFDPKVERLFCVSRPAWAPQWTDARTVHHQQHTPQSTRPTANITRRNAAQQIQFPLPVDTGENEPRELDAHSFTYPVARQI